MPIKPFAAPMACMTLLTINQGRTLRDNIKRQSVTTTILRLGRIPATLLLVLAAGSANASDRITPSSPVIGTGTVYRVVDGDTYVVNIDDAGVFSRFVDDAAGNRGRQRYLDQAHQSIRVRLANIDTAESVHADPARNSAAGRAASDAVKQRLQGHRVKVLCHGWGRYGRSICNVQLNGNAAGDMGLWLIQEGYSQYVTRWGANPYLHQQYMRVAQ